MISDKQFAYASKMSANLVKKYDLLTTLFSRQDSSKKRLRFIEEYEGTKKDLTEALKKTAVVKPRRKLNPSFSFSFKKFN